MAPHHVGDGVIDDDGPEQDEEEERREPHPAGDGSGDERRGDEGEHHLEGRESQEGDGLSVGAGLEADLIEKDPGEVSDDASVVRAEGQ